MEINFKPKTMRRSATQTQNLKQNNFKKQQTLDSGKLKLANDDDEEDTSNTDAAKPKTQTTAQSLSSSLSSSASSSSSSSSYPSQTDLVPDHHHHVIRHRHARHHRNYKNRLDLNESVDDPDSVSIPVMQINTDLPYISFDSGMNKESNDFNDSTENYEKNLKLSTDLNEISIRLNSAKSRPSLSKNQHLHRSTPNLGVSSDHVDGQNGNLISLNNKHQSNLIMNNYPSNLELSTNNQIYDDLILSNNPKIMNNLKLLNSASASTSQQTLIINNKSNKNVVQRFKLLVEGDVHVCKLAHSRNVISKILSSKLLRRWKAHRLVLTDTDIYSTTVGYIFE